ncbi:ABC transporter ATP-binding protein [Brevibacillus laterosporus]|uniref:ABC transporter ATP-binding protein n=1 Tax=Brevibacillus laterosporus TaxID=1465 RepID=UPI000CE396B5|nr:ABC transporter ATP-binding protein [Brevibacillus laterosporus]AYB37453.1 ABC transporter ATP-binding protein [Brevibacillus laterosporus]MBM7111595.1 Bacitracin export ATP-binding protein BceA [Brevibacillus laterosporus]MED1663307.1 ABC transporter ATP-binding protein [Brevibacillus laterosporus]MED1671583.1 ABC transporter ATP-binding protein [Brevibacillus laterosporus]MED1720824.1 ABC transporter ATP-binding protein [Brevibacillus laterosporus]
MSQAIVKVRNIRKEYQIESGTLQVLKGITTDIHQGEIVSIMGPSGSGKSTLLGILGTLDTPTSGQLRIDGDEVTGLNESQLTKYRAKKIGFIFQAYNLISTMTAKENVMLSLMSAKGKSNSEMEQKTLELLDMVGMKERCDHLPSQLSGGQQQRVAIARALANQPSIIIADEPTGNLDSKTGKLILNLICGLREKVGTTFIVATHDPNVAEISDRVLHILDGQIQEN